MWTQYSLDRQIIVVYNIHVDEYMELIGKRPGRPKGPAQIGNCHYWANELGISPKRLRYILRMLTPEHLRVKPSPDGHPVPTYGRLSASQVAMLERYVLGTKVERKRMRQGVSHVP